MSFYILSPLPTTSGGTGTVVAPTAGQVPIGNANGTYTPGSIASGISGVLPIANGGTALSTTPTNGQILIGNGTGYTLSTLTAGANITITNTAGGITIASTGGGGGGAVLESYQVISTNYTVTTASNAFSVGPVTINTGVSVTIPTGQVWLIAA